MAMKILVFGSCVSRDILSEHGESHCLEVVDYYARCSIGSLGAKSIGFDIPLDKIDSAFQRRMVARDISKCFFQDITGMAFDLLLLDLIDERFSIYAPGDGSACTVSPEFLKTGIVPPQDHITASGSDLHFALWETGWTKFCETLDRLGLLNKLCINEVFWSRRTALGNPFSAHHTDVQIEDANSTLSRMYDRIAKDIPRSQFIRFPADVFVGSDQHKWGLSPFHYVDDYYRTAADAISAHRG
jgi:hypothetical protein